MAGDNAAAAVVALLAVGWSVFRAPTAADTSPPTMTFSRLTLLDGVTVDPVISPDGKWVVYAISVSGNQEIYLQSATGQAAINLTKSPANDAQPAFLTRRRIVLCSARAAMAAGCS